MKAKAHFPALANTTQSHVLFLRFWGRLQVFRLFTHLA